MSLICREGVLFGSDFIQGVYTLALLACPSRFVLFPSVLYRRFQCIVFTIHFSSLSSYVVRLKLIFFLYSPSDVIRRDVESNRNNMWPLSCYSYHKEAACVPGLIEVSPEELRLLAYMAKSSGNTATFQKNLEEVGKKQAAILDMYATITTDEVRKLVKKFFFSAISCMHSFSPSPPPPLPPRAIALTTSPDIRM